MRGHFFPALLPSKRMVLTGAKKERENCRRLILVCGVTVTEREKERPERLKKDYENVSRGKLPPLSKERTWVNVEGKEALPWDHSNGRKSRKSKAQWDMGN